MADKPLEHNGRTVVSIEEVARRKKVWPSAVRRAADRGALDWVRLYGRKFIYEDSVDAYDPVYGRGNWSRQEVPAE